MRKRGRADGASSLVVYTPSYAPSPFVKKVNALAKKVGATVRSSEMMREDGVGRKLFVDSYQHEWDDEELDDAFAHCQVVTLGFLEQLASDARVTPLESMLPARHELLGSMKTWPAKLRGHGDERVFPQTFDEWLAMDRRSYGADGTAIGIVCMAGDKLAESAIRRVGTWFEAFFYPARVCLQSWDAPPATKPRGKTQKGAAKREAVSFDTLLAQIEVPADCMAVVGITDLDIYEGEPDEDVVMYGRATGDGAGVMSLFHFKTAGRVFLSSAAHELLHVFGMDHCDDFFCVMNPHCDHEDEESTYMLLCPPCLAKLQESLKFDVRERYVKLLAAFKELGFESDAALAEAILK
jgi:predicted Zn-dependent protease